jgi:ABC-2 type transport system permease protein
MSRRSISWARIAAVIRREYLERVRTKAFWISTLLVPVLMGGMMVIPAWLMARGGGEYTVAVLDLSGRYFERVEERVSEQIARMAIAAVPEIEEVEFDDRRNVFLIRTTKTEEIFEVTLDDARVGRFELWSGDKQVVIDSEQFRLLNVQLEPIENEDAEGEQVDPQELTHGEGLAGEDWTDKSQADLRERAKRRVQQGEFDGLLVLPETLPDEGQPEYVALNVATFQLQMVLERSVNNVLIAERLTGAGFDPERVGELTRRVDLKTFKLGAGGEETRDQGQAFLLSYFFVLIIYMTVLMYGMYVMRGVLEEKSSHIVEVIISTVKPFELMLGKILGIGAVGLTQMLLWSGLGLALSAPAVLAAVGIAGLELPSIPLSLMVFFVVYFVLGYLLYGTLYAGVGAAFDTEQDAQNFQAVITIFLVIPLVLIVQIMNQPDGALSIVLSLIPFFTPILMFLRMTLTQVPPLQIAASVALMVAAILAMAWLVGKIYRVGILMHGSKPKFKDLMRWVREA